LENFAWPGPPPVEGARLRQDLEPSPAAEIEEIAALGTPTALGWRDRLVLYAVYFFASMAIMVLELVAGRLVANNVGSSLYTWTSIICVILAGMSLGNWYAGRLSERYEAAGLVSKLFFLSAALVALTPLFNLALSALKGVFIGMVIENPGGSSHFWGLSVFLMMLLVFLLPAATLGAILPLVVKMAIDRHRSSGRAVGNIYFWGAVGMILGTFLTGFVLVSHLSTTSIVLSVAMAMALLGAVIFLRYRRRAPVAPEPAGVPTPIDIPAARHAASRWRALWTRAQPHAVVFVSSFSLMAMEMVAGRLVSRSVGSSIYTWTCVIGVIFAGMSIGNYFGGRIAARFRPEATLGQLLLLSSFLVFVVLWSNTAIGAADDASAWHPQTFVLRGQPSLTESSLRAIEASGVPREVVARSRALKGRAFEDEPALRAALTEALGQREAAAYGDRFVAHADRLGPAFRALREQGVLNEILRALRPLVDRPFGDEEAFKKEVKRVLREAKPLGKEELAELDEPVALIAAQAKQPSPFGFPIRLLLMVLFVFLPPAIGLGLISPVAAQLAIETGRSTGRSVGNVYAWGAWGSILGTFLAGFFLISAMGAYPVIAAVAVTLALLALAVSQNRTLGAVWLAILLLLALPVFHQIGAPNALDPELPPGREVPPASGIAHLWKRLPEEIGKKIHVRDEDLTENTVDSDYQFIKIASQSRKEGANAPEDVRVLSLDRLVHGYVAFRMPRSDAPFKYEEAVMDTAHLEYDYERSYAVVTARALRDRFTREGRDPGSRLRPPRVTALFIGGGSYTFQRYLVDRYAGATHVARPGDTWESIAEQAYAARSPSARADVAERLRLYNRGLSAAAEESLPPGANVLLPSLADTAEIDPLVTEVNHTRLKLPRYNEEPRIKTWHYDARNFLESALDAGWHGRYDLIYGDAFNHYSIPYHLTTREFNEMVKALLAPGGAYIVNLIDKYETSRLMSAYVHTLRETFRHVYVIADKDKSARSGRNTFVVVATERPLALELLGGLPAPLLELVRKGEIDKVAEEIEGEDPHGYRLIKERFERKDPRLYEDLVEMTRLDLGSLGLFGDEAIRKAEADPEDNRIRIRRQRSLSQEEINEWIVDLGRPPTFLHALRGMFPWRLLSSRAPLPFELSARAFAALKNDLLPEKILDNLQVLRGKRFETVEAFVDRLTDVLAPADLRAHYPALVRHAAVRDLGKGPPLVLTDDYAPVDDLLLPLLEE
jgi:MFS family permease